MASAIAQGPQFFGRVCTAQIDTVQVSGLRVTFDITKSSTKEPNKVQLAIYNLADTTRARIKKQDVYVQLDAGYQQLSAQIFAGTVRTIESVREGTEWITRVTGGDGEKPIRQQRVSISFKAGTSVATALIAMANATGINLGNVPTIAAKGAFRKNLQVFQGGYIAQGGAYDALSKLSATLGYQLSVQDGALTMLPVGGANQVPAVLLSSQSGLYGSPEVGEKGVLKATSLLNGAFYPGRQVNLQSQRYNGFYRVQKVSHKGDTHSSAVGSWISALELTPIKLLPGATPP